MSMSKSEQKRLAMTRPDKFKTVTCLKCGWVYFQVSLAYAKNEVKRFNEYFDTLTDEWKENFGGRHSVLSSYLNCWCGNEYLNFRDSNPGDSPDGCTLNPILARHETDLLGE